MKVHIPSPLLTYTNGQTVVEGRGKTTGDVLRSLDKDFPGITFRMLNEMGELRRHIRLFVDGESNDGLDTPVTKQTELHIVAALSGG